MSQWAALGDDGSQMNSSQVEYVGVVEDDEADDDFSALDDDIGQGVRPPVRQDVEIVDRRPAATFKTANGYVSMNKDAFVQAARSPNQVIGDKTVRKIGPNMYAVLNENNENQGMGVDKTAGTTASSSWDWGSGLSTILDTAGQAVQAGLEFQAGQTAQAAQLEAQRIAAQTEAAAREAARLEQQQQFQQQMAMQQQQFEQQMAQITAQREQAVAQGMTAAQAAAAYPTPTPPVMAVGTSQGMPGWAWALIGVGGLAAVGGLVYTMSKK